MESLPATSRRCFCATGLSLAGWSLACASKDSSKQMEERLCTGVGLGELKVGFFKEYAAHGVFLARDAQGVYALHNRCPHAGARVQMGGAQLLCPAHGAQFDWRGQSLSLAYPSPLPQILVYEETPGGPLMVDRRILVPSGTRYQGWDLREREFDSGLRRSDLKPWEFRDLIQKGRCFLCLDDVGVYAISSVCTHAGCNNFWEMETHSFVCPCHYAVFDANGVQQVGPSAHSLIHFQVREIYPGGPLLIDPTTIVEWDRRI